jgi:integrase/recombinase XerD
MRSQ